jgi:hypothetical protein
MMRINPHTAAARAAGSSKKEGGGELSSRASYFAEGFFFLSLPHHFVCGIKERIDSAMTICWRTQIVLRAWEMYRRSYYILTFGVGIESNKTKLKKCDGNNCRRENF